MEKVTETDKKTYEEYLELPEGAPDIVMEILSPSTAYYDLRHKKSIYAETGVREYWIIDPMERTAEVFANREGDFVMTASIRCGAAGKSETVASSIYSELNFDCQNLFGY